MEVTEKSRWVRNCWSCKYSTSDNDGNTLCTHSKQPLGYIIIDFDPNDACEDYKEVKR